MKCSGCKYLRYSKRTYHRGYGNGIGFHYCARYKERDGGLVFYTASDAWKLACKGKDKETI